jgi:RNA recognition motif-containing protein
VSWKKDMRETNPDANVFVKELDETVDIKTLDSVFCQFGAIFSSKIPEGDDGKPLGYGYV